MDNTVDEYYIYVTGGRPCDTLLLTAPTTGTTLYMAAYGASGLQKWKVTTFSTGAMAENDVYYISVASGKLDSNIYLSHPYGDTTSDKVAVDLYNLNTQDY